MIKIKRIAAAVLAAAMLTAFAGCGDQSWSYKTGDTSLSAGTYIFNLLNAYYEAYDKVESADEADKILEEEVEDSDGSKKTVDQYTIDAADKTTMRMLAVEELFKKYGLELNTTDYEMTKTYSDSMWGYSKDMFEGYGISQDSFTYCYAEYGVKYGQVFETLYGKDGEKAVSDEEMTNYFTDKYTGYAYFSVSMSEYDDETGESILKSDEEFTRTEDYMKAYVEMVNKDGKSYSDIVKSYMDDFAEDYDPTLSGAVDLEETTMNTTVVDTLKTLDEGKAAYVKYGEGTSTMFYFVYRPTTESITDFLDTEDSSDDDTIDVATFDTASSAVTVGKLKSGYTHSSLLNEMKGDEYDEYLDEYAKTLSVEKNSNILNSFKPKMFVKKDSDTNK